jgi:alpha-L-rhamnosidase
MVKSGEDTLWETFDGNASHNHIMFGDFSAWAYEYVAGIRIVEPGFRKVSLKPNYVEGLESIEARYRTPFGEITAGWKRGADGKPVFKYSLPEGIELVK